MVSDDPEERIRELERQLADVRSRPQRPADVVSPPYTQYGPHLAPQRRTVPTAWRYAIGTLVLVVIGLVIAVVAHLVIDDGGGASVDGGGGPVSVSQGGALTLAGNNENQSIACNDGSLTLSANNSTFTVTGHCAGLRVTGSHDHVTVESSDAVEVTGFGDTVTDAACNEAKLTISGYNDELSTVGHCVSLAVSSYGNQVRADSIDTITVSNYGNTLTLTGHCKSLTISMYNNQAKVDTVETVSVSGYDNVVTYHSGSPKITQAGSGITVKQG
jgi:uncharacterized protein (DUF2345 family)